MRQLPVTVADLGCPNRISHDSSACGNGSGNTAAPTVLNKEQVSDHGPVARPEC